MGIRNIALNYMVDNGMVDGTQKEQLTPFLPAGQGSVGASGLLTNATPGFNSTNSGPSLFAPSPVTSGTVNVPNGHMLNLGNTFETGVKPTLFDTGGLTLLSSSAKSDASDTAGGNTTPAAPAAPAAPGTSSEKGFIAA